MSTSDLPSPDTPVARLLAIMAALRTPGTGCPWDLEQTFETIAPYTIEEAYEVADAIARGDRADLKDELGDLLLQVVYHARMAEEHGAFAFDDVARAVSDKMIRRHPHVFGSAEERAAGALPDFWARIKADEKSAKDHERTRLNVAASQAGTPSLLADVPAALPGLTRAVKLQGKAACVGFDWPELAPVFDKLAEEVSELREVALPADPRGIADRGGIDKIAEEFGDVLFVMANIARHLQIDPEAAVRAANQKFIRRFQFIEQRLANDGRNPAQSTLDEMDALWNEIRQRDKSDSTI